MSDRVTIDHNAHIAMSNQIHELKALLRKAKNTIDHARKWRKNTDPDYNDSGTYRLVSEEIDKALK